MKKSASSTQHRYLQCVPVLHKPICLLISWLDTLPSKFANLRFLAPASRKNVNQILRRLNEVDDRLAAVNLHLSTKLDLINNHLTTTLDNNRADMQYWVFSEKSERDLDKVERDSAIAAIHLAFEGERARANDRQLVLLHEILEQLRSVHSRTSVLAATLSATHLADNNCEMNHEEPTNRDFPRV